MSWLATDKQHVKYAICSVSLHKQHMFTNPLYAITFSLRKGQLEKRKKIDILRNAYMSRQC